MENRVGIGYDIHRLAEGRKLLLGGIEIPYIKGLLGHSDADVLLHALIDSLLGAIGLPDIGEQFPDSDPKYHNISSLELLRKAVEVVREKNFKIVNIDAVVIAEEPSLVPFKKKIQESLARALDISVQDVGIKAKTAEGLGEIGAKSAIACFCVALLAKEAN